MTKQSGLGAAFWIDGRDLSGDIASLSRMNNSRNLLEMTAIDVEAMERSHGQRDGGLELDSYYNVAAGAQFASIGDTPAAGQRIATYAHRKATIGTPVFCLVCRQAESAGNRGNDGSFTWTHSMESDAWGIDWAKLLTAGKRTDTTATNGTAVDFGAASTFGLQAYLQVFAFTGTSVTIKLQMDTASNFPSSTDVTGGGFTLVTSAPQAQRLQTSRTFATEQFLRVSTSGTFTSVQFAVAVRVNAVSNIL